MYVYETNKQTNTQNQISLYTSIHTVISHHPPKICRYNDKKYGEETELNAKQQTSTDDAFNIYIYYETNALHSSLLLLLLVLF